MWSVTKTDSSHCTANRFKVVPVGLAEVTDFRRMCHKCWPNFKQPGAQDVSVVFGRSFRTRLHSSKLWALACLYTNWFALHKPYRQSRHPPLPLLDAKQPCCETPGVISVIVLSCALNYTLIDVNISVILTNRNVTASSSTDPWCCLYSDMDVMSPCFFYKYYSVSQSPLHLKTFASTTRLVYRVVPPKF